MKNAGVIDVPSATAAAGSDAQAGSISNRGNELKAHPLSFPKFEAPELESGWLVDAVHQRFPELGGSSVSVLLISHVAHANRS